MFVQYCVALFRSTDEAYRYDRSDQEKIINPLSRSSLALVSKPFPVEFNKICVYYPIKEEPHFILRFEVPEDEDCKTIRREENAVYIVDGELHYLTMYIITTTNIPRYNGRTRTVHTHTHMVQERFVADKKKLHDTDTEIRHNRTTTKTSEIPFDRRMLTTI